MLTTSTVRCAPLLIASRVELAAPPLFRERLAAVERDERLELPARVERFDDEGEERDVVAFPFDRPRERFAVLEREAVDRPFERPVELLRVVLPALLEERELPLCARPLALFVDELLRCADERVFVSAIRASLSAISLRPRATPGPPN